MKKISAKFIGTNGSMGYEHGKVYDLYLMQGDQHDDYAVSITRERPPEDKNELIPESAGLCLYTTFFAFLDNWDRILNAHYSDK